MVNYRLVMGRALAVGLVATAGCGAESGGDGPVSASGAAVTLNAVTRESFDNQGRQGNGSSNAPYISGNQRYVAFQSDANVWASAVDTNGTTDIYLKDRQTGTITLVSQSNGVVGNGASFSPSVSDDGRVVFASNATNLVPGTTGTAILVRAPNGTISRVDNAIAGQPNGASSRPQISGDGQTVIFQSVASNLVAGDNNGASDVFVASALGGGGAQRVSLTNANGEPNGASFDGSISFDSRFVAFSSDATNIIFNDGNGATDVFARDRQGAGVTVPISFATTGQGGSVGNGASTQAQISSDGHWVSFRSLATNFAAADTNNVADIYLNAVGSGQSPVRVSVSSAGAQAIGASFQSTVSTNGKAVAFVSSATNLVAGDTNNLADVFVHDMTTAQTIRIQNGATQPNAPAAINSSLRFSGTPSSPSFSFLVFDSAASNLVSGDSNNFPDVFSASLSP
jgi:hypothetical protein